MARRGRTVEEPDRPWRRFCEGQDMQQSHRLLRLEERQKMEACRSTTLTKQRASEIVMSQRSERGSN